MRIFVDADACPKVIREILYRASKRTGVELILVANRYLHVPVTPLIKVIIVASGIDEADKQIAELVCAGDLVITADIPLADIVVTKNGIALNPRGTLYTKENIKRSLATRNLMEQLRDNKVISGGPPVFNKSDSESLANQLDKILAQAKNKIQSYL